MNDSVEGVAIIGMAGQVPGAKHVDAFWRNLRDGVESVRFFSAEELEAAGISPALLSEPNYVRARGVLDDIELFDPAFFGYSPREAEVMDPQHRLFLECAWEALESAGYNADAYEGRIGVYAGVGLSNYLLFNLIANADLIKSAGEYQILLGNDKDYLATRVSYKLNLKGPSVVVQTSCSSSLVAVHLACQSLLNYQTDMALAGGVSIGVRQTSGYSYQDGGILSPDGHCRAFDANAAGTVGGNGLGIVVLKRLEDALADGDTIHGVIKGSAVNNDGSLKVGYTAPSVEGQAEVIAEALAVAGVKPEAISYIEAHGTGTTLGDPIEIAALKKVFRASAKEKAFCAIGSVKTNIGHLDTAAGVTGLIKTVLALKHRQIPPSLHFETPNPAAGLENSPFYVNTRLADWQAAGTPRRAGVSSFGIGGTNAHVIVEEAPLSASAESAKPAQLLALSARSDAALEAATENLLAYLKQHRDLKLADVAYTLQVGRKPFNQRRALVCHDLNDAVARLEERKSFMTGAAESAKPSVVFMFSGQGAQYVDMGIGLYRSERVFREEVERCSALLVSRLGFDLREALYPDPQKFDEATERLTQTALAQPALFVIQYALAKLWMSWGIRPKAMIGHSIGEYAAACLAGVFSLEDALALVAARGRLMQQLPTGAMLAVSLTEQELRLRLTDARLSLAAVNSTSLCTVSGPTEAINEFDERLTEQGVTCRRLHTSHAFHSTMMDPILAPFIEVVKKIELKPPALPYISNVTGDWISEQEATDPNYWALHLKQTVRFADGVNELLKDTRRLLLEVGPGQTLSAFVRQRDDAKGIQVFSSLRHPLERRLDELFALETLGRLWLAGAEVAWDGLHGNEQRRRVTLPTYPFERQRYWVEPRTEIGVERPRPTATEKKPDLTDWFYAPCWKQLMPPELLRADSLSGMDSNWLVFTDELGLGSQIAKRLKEQGQNVVSVRAGEEFIRRGEGDFTINPRERANYEALLQELRASHSHPEKIVHLWSVTPQRLTNGASDVFEKCQEAGFYSLLFLTQALDKQRAGEALRIGVVSNNMQEVTGKDQWWPEKATLLGACKVIPQEYLNITCQSIDIEVPETCKWKEERLVSQIIAELNRPLSEYVVAYRAGNRWAQGFEPMKLRAADAEKIHLREEGVYLITGGLGNIGLAFSEHLARTARAKLALLGRTPFPQRSEWAQWLESHAEQDGTSAKIRRLQAMERHGAEILILSADVASEQQMQAAVNHATERFGAINGVVHAAGAVGMEAMRAIQELGRAECERQFGAKVHGVKVLEKVLDGKHLDFCLLQSSLAAVLGGLGYFAYSAANLFMDAFAHRHNQDSEQHWVSVNWDGWQLDEETEQGDRFGATLTQLTIKAREGIEAFERILSGQVITQVAVSSGDLQSRIAQWIELESSRGPGGAKDEDKLLLHTRPNLPIGYAPPRNDYERSIAEVWQELLGVKPIGLHDNFFDLGGHSLLGTQLISRLRQMFQVEVALRNIFEKPTVAELAGAIEEALAALDAGHEQDTALAPLITPRSDAGPVVLSFAQERLWFLYQLDPDNSAYNISFALRLKGQFDIPALERSLSEIVRRHEALRTTFTILDDKPRQVIAAPAPLRLNVEDLSDAPADEREAKALRLAREAARQPFDLSSGPLFRVRLLRLSGDEHVLLLTMSHIISDGWSMGVLIREVATLYESFTQGRSSPLEELTIQYPDFAVWQKKWLTGEVLDKQLSYWREQLAGAPAALDLPTDRPRPAVQTFHGSSEQFELSEDLSQRLRDLSRGEGATLFMLLLAAFQTLLHRYTGQKDIIVSTSIANRNRVETELLIGFFINQLMLRANLAGNPTFRQLLHQVRETTLGAYAHQDLPFEKVLEETQPERDPSRAPLAQVLFVLQNAPAPILDLPGLTLDIIDIGDETAKLDLILAMSESPRGLIGGAIEYNTDLFDASTIKLIASHFETLLHEVSSNPNLRLLDIPLTAEAQGQTSSGASGAHDQFTADQFNF